MKTHYHYWFRICLQEIKTHYHYWFPICLQEIKTHYHYQLPICLHEIKTHYHYRFLDGLFRHMWLILLAIYLRWRNFRLFENIVDSSVFRDVCWFGREGGWFGTTRGHFRWRHWWMLRWLHRNRGNLGWLHRWFWWHRGHGLRLGYCRFRTHRLTTELLRSSKTCNGKDDTCNLIYKIFSLEEVKKIKETR